MTVEAQMSEVKAEIAAMKKANPKLRFRTAWEALKRKRPELFAEDSAPVENASKEAPGDFYYKQAIGVIHAEEPSQEMVTFVDPDSGRTLARVPATYLDDPWYNTATS